MAKETKMNKVIPETYGGEMSTKKIKVYPTFRLGDDDLPNLKTMEVGKKYKIEMEVEVMSKEQGNSYNQNETDKSIRATFKVMKVGCDMDGDDKKETKPTTSGKDFEMEYAKKRSGGTGSRFDKKA